MSLEITFLLAVSFLGQVDAGSLDVLDARAEPQRMLYRYLGDENLKLLAERRKVVESLKTPDDVLRRQREMKVAFLEALGEFPEKTPFNPRRMGTLQRNGYRIEKVIYEIRPDHHVPANFYVPDGPAPFPAVLFPCGHSSDPKAYESYQKSCILLAKNGMASLIFDPIGQGERYQTATRAAAGTSEHTLVDVGARLIGSCAANYFTWDDIRSLDYLASRPEVDATRLGCMGNSGGGIQTAFLMALDERVACAVPNCFITSVERLIESVGPQDGESNIPGQTAFGLNHADFCLMRAPAPTQLSCPTRDFFDIRGCWESFREAKRTYGILGHGERMDLFEYDDVHSINKPFREAGVRWLRRWLMKIDDAPVEGDLAISRPEELQCTLSGQVMKDFQERTTYSLTAARAAELAAQRRVLTGDELSNSVRRLIGIPGPSPAASSPKLVGEPIRRSGYRIQRAVFQSEPGISLPACIFTPDEIRAGTLPVLYVHGDGKSHEAALGGAIERLVREGQVVTAIDLRGMGETEPEPPHRGLVVHFKADWKEAYLAMHLRRPLLGQRVRDILVVAEGIDKGTGVRLIAVGRAAPAALHAAALDPRIREVTLEGMVLSWTNVAQTAVTFNQLTNVVHGALKVYDFPDLAAAVAPRPLTLLGTLDAAGKPVSREEVEKTYAPAKAAYAARGFGDRLVMQSKEMP